MQVLIWVNKLNFCNKWIPYTRHYKPRLVYFFTPFPKTIYELWPLVLCMACIQERPMMARVRYRKWIDELKANDFLITQKVPTSIRMKIFNTYCMTWLNLTFQLRILPYDKTVDETDNLPKTKEDDRIIDYWNLFIERCVQESMDIQRKNWISTDDVVSISSTATIAIPGKWR